MQFLYEENQKFTHCDLDNFTFFSNTVNIFVRFNNLNYNFIIISFAVPFCFYFLELRVFITKRVILSVFSNSFKKIIS